jgi:hypothetical protein
MLAIIQCKIFCIPICCPINIKTYRTIILPTVLYGCATRSFTLREGCRLRVFEKRVLRRIFRARRDEVTGEQRKLHKEELNNLYSSPNIVRFIKSRMRWVGYVACMGKWRGIYCVFVRKLEGKRPPARPKHRWKDNIMMDLQKVECRGIDWIKLAQEGIDGRHL